MQVEAAGAAAAGEALTEVIAEHTLPATRTAGVHIGTVARPIRYLLTMP